MNRYHELQSYFFNANEPWGKEARGKNEYKSQRTRKKCFGCQSVHHSTTVQGTVSKAFSSFRRLARIMHTLIDLKANNVSTRETNLA